MPPHPIQLPRTLAVKIAAGCAALTLALRIPGWTDALGNDEAGAALVGASWLRGEQAAGAAQLYGAYWHDRPPLTALLYGIAERAGSAHGVRSLGALAAVLLVTLTVLLVRELGGGRRAALLAGVLTAALASAPTLRADHAYGELIAAPFTVGALLALLRARRPASPRLCLLALGGALAACAVLVKQSALDAPLAGTLMLVVALARARTRAAAQHLAAWIGGALLVIAILLTWAASTGNLLALWQATVAFRVEVIDARGYDTTPLRLLAPFIASGMVLLVPFALAAITAPRSPLAPTTRLLLGAWLVAATVGMLGGGFYWGHYLIQLAPVLVVSTALLLDAAPPARRALPIALAGVLVACTVTGSIIRHEMPHAGSNDELARDIGSWVAARAAPGDELLVLYARPGVVHASGLPNQSPYLWWVMQYTRSDTRGHILAALRRDTPPRWIVRWNHAAAFGLDRDGAISLELTRRYRPVTRIGGRQVLQRIDPVTPSQAPGS